MKLWIGLLAVLGFGIAAVMVVVGNRQESKVKAALPAPRAPFERYISGQGILEASTQNIALGTPVSGIVADVYIKWGDRVKPGDSLFKIDDRDLRAALVSVKAKVTAAGPVLDNARYHLELAEKLGSYLSQEELVAKRYEVATDEAALKVAKAQVKEVEMEIDRRIIRAPVAGRILAINVRPGEFAASDATATPLMVLGNDDTLLVRVEVDEQDAWRVRPGAKAEAYLRGNPAIQMPILFQRIEPQVVPKSLLTGGSTERTDVRVLQVIFAFNRDSYPVYVGQVMDVFIEVPPPNPDTNPK